MPNTRSHRIVEFARDLRRTLTPAERALWSCLKGRHFAKLKFRRQQPIGTFIADFVCFEIKLVVELDGGYHRTHKQKLFDAERTAFLAESGFTVIRFTNDEILNALPEVLEHIRKVCRDLSS
jgi:very-short-patch-repair endonuclease